MFHSYCWVRGTYYLPHDEYVPTEEELNQSDGSHKNITYYQWVPAILLVQALLFYLPYFVWTNLGPPSCGIDLHSLIDSGYNFEATEMSEIKDKRLGYMTQQFDRLVLFPVVRLWIDSVRMLTCFSVGLINSPLHSTDLHP